MPTPVNASSTHNAGNLKEDLSDIAINISPTDRPLTRALGKPGKMTSVFKQWIEISLSAANANNAVTEGADATASAPNTGKRLGNYAQLAEKVAQVTSTAEAADGVGGLQGMAQQVAMKTKEMMNDVEASLVHVNHAVPGSAAIPGVSASFLSFLHTNTSRGVGGANPTLSGGDQGYPNAAPVDGALRDFTEDLLVDVMQSIWQEGGDPSLSLMPGGLKKKFSGFTGDATKNRDAEDQKVFAAVTVYVCDFGTVKAVPSRYMRSRDALIIDPNRAKLVYLQTPKQVELAKTGHSDSRLISCQFSLVVDSEKAHGAIADLQ